MSEQTGGGIAKAPVRPRRRCRMRGSVLVLARLSGARPPTIDGPFTAIAAPVRGVVAFPPDDTTLKEWY
ncbi:MAG: hypothetical protein K2X74_08565 [Acetobacteraceae bacterium]|nr:hypothetical protein [Acetobacteraceae bacterium]